MGLGVSGIYSTLCGKYLLDRFRGAFWLVPDHLVYYVVVKFLKNVSAGVNRMVNSGYLDCSVFFQNVSTDLNLTKEL